MTLEKDNTPNPDDSVPVPVTDGHGNPTILMVEGDLVETINNMSELQYKRFVQEAVRRARATKGEGREGQQDRKPKGFGKS
jgi:hypothetical protein